MLECNIRLEACAKDAERAPTRVRAANLIGAEALKDVGRAVIVYKDGSLV
jgi:hypothetical protein